MHAYSLQRLAMPIAVIGSLCVSQLASAQDVSAPSKSSAAVPLLTGGVNCTVNKAAFIVAGDLSNFVQTKSTAFVTMPNMGRQITITAAGCVIAEFAGEMTADVSNRPYLQVVAVGQAAPAAPGPVTTGYPSSPGNFESRSMRFFFQRLLPGTYTVRLQWRSEASTTNVYARARTLTIYYR